MAEKRIKTPILLKNDSRANFDLNKTKVWSKGEPIIVFESDGSARLYVGDGVTTMENLLPLTLSKSDVAKLTNIEEGAQVNVIESISVNNVAVDVTEKGVNITVPTGALASKDKVAESDLDSELAAKAANWDKAQANVIEAIQVNGAALAIADKLVNILIATGSADGTLAVNGVDVAIKGLLGLAYKAEVSEDELASALKTKINGKVDASYVGSIPDGATATTVIAYIAEAVAAAVADADHLKRKIADSTSAISLTAKDADQYIYMVPNDEGTYDEYMVVDQKLEKVGDWKVNLSDYAKDADLTALKNLVGTLPSTATATTIVGYIDEAIAALNLSGELDKKVDKVEGSRLMTSDEATKLAGITEGATKVEASTTNGNMVINGEEKTVYTLPDTVLDVNDTLILDGGNASGWAD
jgi:hypothetical protein